MPSEVQARVAQFLVGIDRIIDDALFEPDAFLGKLDMDRIIRVQHTYEKIVEAMRESLGTDPLSQETLHLIGKGPTKRLGEKLRRQDA